MSKFLTDVTGHERGQYIHGNNNYDHDAAAAEQGLHRRRENGATDNCGNKLLDTKSVAN